MWLHAEQQHDNHLTFKWWMLKKEKSKEDTAAAQHSASQQVAVVTFTSSSILTSLTNWPCAQARLNLGLSRLFKHFLWNVAAAQRRHWKFFLPAQKNILINIDEWCFTLPEVLLLRWEASSVPGQVLDSGTGNGCERRWRERPYWLLVAPVQLLTGGVQEAVGGK